MSRVTAPPSAPPSTPHAGGGGSAITGSISNPKPPVSELPVGTLIRGEVVARLETGEIIVRSDQGQLTLRLNRSVDVGAQINLQIQTTGNLIRVLVVSIEHPATNAASSPTTTTTTAPAAVSPPLPHHTPTPDVALSLSRAGESITHGLPPTSTTPSAAAGVPESSPQALVSGTRLIARVSSLPREMAAGNTPAAPVRPPDYQPSLVREGISSTNRGAAASTSLPQIHQVLETLGSTPSPPSSLSPPPAASSPSPDDAWRPPSFVSLTPESLQALDHPSASPREPRAAATTTTPAPLLSLIEGHKIPLVIRAMAPPSSPSASHPDALTGLVLRTLPNGDILVSLPQHPKGLILVLPPAATPIPSNSQIVFDLPPAPATAAAAPRTPHHSHTLAPVVQDMARLMTGDPTADPTHPSLPILTGGMSVPSPILAAAPQVGHAFTSGVLFLLTALAAGKLSDWIEPARLEQFLHALPTAQHGKENAVSLKAAAERLERTFGNILKFLPARAATEATDAAASRAAGTADPAQPATTGRGGEWRMLPLPVYTGEQVSLLPVYYRQDSSSQAPDALETGTELRIDLNLTRLGKMELHCRFAGKNAHASLHADRPLPPFARQDLQTLYTSLMEATGFSGRLVIGS